MDLYLRGYQLFQSRDDLRNNFKTWIEADVYGSCRVKQFINCSYMKRAVTAHEATLLVLYRSYFKSRSLRYPGLFLGPCGFLYSTVSLQSEACESRDEYRTRELHKQ